ncbi:MAG TPA: hypothetical protein VGK02_03400 [Candidatus Aquicultor sp.]
MTRRAQVVAIIGLALPLYGILWYVAGAFLSIGINLIAVAIAISIAYLFLEALSCQSVRGSILKINLRRKLDIKEVARIIGPIALLPAASIIIAQQSLASSVKPLRLYVLFVLLFLVGWAMGTVETANLIDEDEKNEAL